MTFIDPPDGWQFGFPKPIPDNIKAEDFEEWLIEEGYPKELIDFYGERFYIRIFSKDD